MNKEDYVSLEVAKLLKEKGYDEDCNILVAEECWSFNKGKLTCVDKDREFCPLPTLYEAQKWLIGKAIYVSVDVYGDGQWMPTLCEFGREKYNFIPLDVSREKTYEEALNAGILEALKLI